MSTINVNFRIVGIYFGADYAGSATGPIKVEVQEKPTVFDVMDAVRVAATRGEINGIDSFNFVPANPGYGGDDCADGEFLDSVRADFNVSPNGSLGPGIYRLDETAGSDNPQLVLQYYIFDSDFVQKNRKNEQVPFNCPPPVEIEDGDTVIWRLVGIATGPDNSRLTTARQRRALHSMKARLAK